MNGGGELKVTYMMLNGHLDTVSHQCRYLNTTSPSCSPLCHHIASSGIVE